MKMILTLTLIISSCIGLIGCGRIPKEGNYLVFKGEHTNCGLLSSEEDYWSSTTFELNRNGELKMQKKYNLSGIQEKTVQLTDEQVSYVCEIMESQKYEFDKFDGNDGSVWDFNYYDDKGKEISDYSGYIYHNEKFLELEKFLYSHFND